MEGTIKKLVTEKGFGFIAREGGAKDLFFHRDKVAGVSFDDLKEGDKVTFEVNETGPKGPAAENVARV